MEDRPKGKNRRVTLRRKVAFTLTYGVAKPYILRVDLGLTDELDAIMLDLSESGMAMITGLELPKSTLLNIKFNFRNLLLTGQQRSRQMELTAEVASCVAVSKGNYRIGIYFNKISDEDKEAIRDFIKRSR